MCVCITGMFYFMLSNVSPNKRSKLRGIQLLAICKQIMIKRYGINQVLKPIVDDIKAMVNMTLFMVLYNRVDYLGKWL